MMTGMGEVGGEAVWAAVHVYLAAMCRGFESHPSSSFFFSEKKELFGLVAFPFFLFIEKSFHDIIHCKC